MDNNNTIFFSVTTERHKEVREIINSVYLALQEKGFNPVIQMVGYVMSGDPTYITSHKNARSLITKVERDEIVEELFKFYIAEGVSKRQDGLS